MIVDKTDSQAMKRCNLNERYGGRSYEIKVVAKKLLQFFLNSCNNYLIQNSPTVKKGHFLAATLEFTSFSKQNSWGLRTFFYSWAILDSLKVALQRVLICTCTLLFYIYIKFVHKNFNGKST